MSHLPKITGFLEGTKKRCNCCGYAGEPTAMRLHMRVKHNKNKEIIKSAQMCNICNVRVPGGGKELVKHSTVYHKSGAEVDRLVNY